MLDKPKYTLKPYYYKALILSSLISFITFSDFNPVYTIGIDDSISWAYNYLFNKDISLLKNLIFPHGPLAFLLYPLATGNNLTFSLIIICVLKIMFSMNIFVLYQHRYKSILGPVVISYILMSLLNVQLIIIGLVISSVLNYLKTNNRYWPFVAIIFSVFGLYIKTYCGIVSLMIILSLIGYVAIYSREYKYSLSITIFLFFSYLLFWLFLFRSFEGFPTFFKGIYELSLDNSSAASIYPDNNWIYLGLSFLCIIIIPLIHKQKQVYIFYALTVLAVLATWKYSFSREDITHARTLLYLLILIAFLIFSLIKKHEFSTLILCISAIALYYLNLDNALNYNELSFNVIGVNKAEALISDREGITNYYNSQSEKNIISNKLEEGVREKIGKRSIDIYPWEYTYVPINDFNWQPRRVLQSYASYTSWLDLQNAKHFASKSAPDFILWEIDKGTIDLNGGDMESIDQRYLLNDEPQTFNSILSNYKFSEKGEKVLLLEKRDHSLSYKEQMISTKNISFNQWTDVPVLREGILKAKLKITNNFKGRLISSLYKDQAFFIYYKLENKVVLKYRFVPKNALDGIWVNPFIYSAKSNINDASVIQIKIVAGDLSSLDDNIEIQWLNYNYENRDSNYEVLSFFGKDNKVNYNNILSSTFNNNDKLWSNKKDSLLMNDYYSAPSSYLIDKSNYPLTFKISLDSIIKENNINDLQVESHLWVNTNKKNRSKLVISISDDSGIKYYNDVKLSEFINDNNKWTFINIIKGVPKEILSQKNSFIKVYIWNLDKEVDLKIDDLEVNISAL